MTKEGSISRPYTVPTKHWAKNLREIRSQHQLLENILVLKKVEKPFFSVISWRVTKFVFIFPTFFIKIRTVHINLCCSRLVDPLLTLSRVHFKLKPKVYSPFKKWSVIRPTLIGTDKNIHFFKEFRTKLLRYVL